MGLWRSWVTAPSPASSKWCDAIPQDAIDLISDEGFVYPQFSLLHQPEILNEVDGRADGGVCLLLRACRGLISGSAVGSGLSARTDDREAIERVAITVDSRCRECREE